MTADSIKNLCLLALGYEEEIDFADTSNSIVAKFNIFYGVAKTSTIQRYPWTFSIKDVELSGQTDLTDKEFLYSYDLPTDFIVYRNAFHASNMYTPILNYRVDLQNGKFYTDSNAVFLRYSYETDEIYWPQYFIDYFKYKMAMDICYNFTGDSELLATLQKQEQFYYLDSKSVDARQTKTKVIKSSPFTAVRAF